jgi:hypothetical protein
MKTSLGLLFAAAFAVTSTAPAAAQDLQLSMRDGRVTLIAENVPVSRILAEWARIGQATVLNGDKLTGPPVTLHFENQPERDVLDVLLRSASGYIVAPRQVAMANASVFDRVLIMPTSRPPGRFGRAAASVQPAAPRPSRSSRIIDDDPAERPGDASGRDAAGCDAGSDAARHDAAEHAQPERPNDAADARHATDADDAAAARHAGSGPGPGGVQNPYVPQPPTLPPGVRPPGGGDRDDR